MVADEARRLEDLAPVVPVHVGHDVVDVDALDRQEVERDDVHPVELAQLAGDVHVDTLVVHVVRTTDEHDAELARLVERGESALAGLEQGGAERILGARGGVESGAYAPLVGAQARARLA